MTNEEKANELARLYRMRLAADTTLCNDDINAASVEVYERCLKMAEWKDQQFKERMEKKISHLEDSRKNWNVQSNRYIAFGITILNLKSIINELLE